MCRSFAPNVQYPVLNYRMYEWDLGFYADDDDVLYVYSMIIDYLSVYCIFVY